MNYRSETLFQRCVVLSDRWLRDEISLHSQCVSSHKALFSVSKGEERFVSHKSVCVSSGVSGVFKHAAAAS